MSSMFITIISFIIIFTVVVVSHEFGHFLIARQNGIKVNEFAIGMGPVIFKKMIRGTRFVIRLLPIGGACMFEGEDGNYEDEEEKETPEIAKEGSFNAAPVWGRIATVLAGPIFNILLAYLLSLFLCWFCGSDLPTVKEVTGGYPAEAAGMQGGDRIVKMGHQTIHLWREISVLSYISDGSPVEVTYERDGQQYETLITPIYSAEDGRFYYGFVGSGEYIDCDNLSVFKYSWYEVRYWLISTVQSLKYMIQGRASAEDIAGPVGVATVIGDTVEQTVDKGAFVVIVEMVNIAVLLSVNLGVLNLLPLPALDGGRLVFLLIEAVRGKRVPPEKEGLVHMVGFVLLMLLMVFVLYNDIMRIIG